MKRNVFILLSLFAGQVAMAQKNVCRIVADLDEIGDTLIALVGENKYTFEAKEDGTFDMAIPVSKVTNITVMTPGTLAGTQRLFFPLIAVPGEKAVVDGNLTERFDITGSKFYKKYHDVDIFVEKAQLPLITTAREVNEQIESGKLKFEEAMPEFEKTMANLQATFNEKLLNFVKNHSKEETSVPVILQITDPAIRQQALDALSQKVRNGRMKSLLSE